jgi:AraC-like DNA-binding protein
VRDAIVGRDEGVGCRENVCVSAPVQRAPGDVLVHLRRARDRVDRDYAQPLDLDDLARTAGISKYHFHRLFTATYGMTPAAYLSRRRIERAQDLLRATNLTVTEVCYAVGFSSLGSFSARFRAVVGEGPREFQRRWGAQAPRIPGCFVLMWGLAEQRASDEGSADGSAIQEKQGQADRR